MNFKKIVLIFLSIGMVFSITSVFAEGNDTYEPDTSSENVSVNGTSVADYGSQYALSINNSGNNVTDSDSDVSLTPEIYNKIEHPNEETDVKSSTPDGNPLIPKYAQGGVNVDIMGHLMEGRGDDTNVSSEITFHDHTSVNGYITTLIKDFHYISKVDSESED